MGQTQWFLQNHFSHGGQAKYCVVVDVIAARGSAEGCDASCTSAGDDMTITAVIINASFISGPFFRDSVLQIDFPRVVRSPSCGILSSRIEKIWMIFFSALRVFVWV